MPTQKIALKLTPLDPPLALFLLSAVFGLWPAYDRSLCWNTLSALAAGFLLYVVISRLAVPKRGWACLAILAFLASALLSLYFVTQYAHFGYAEKVGAIGRLGAWIGKFIPPVGRQASVIWVPVANSVATFLEGMFFLAVALALAARRWVWRIGGAIGAGLIGLALALSASRGAWLAVVVASLLWLALYWRPARVVALLGAVVALGLVVYVVVRRDITVLGQIPVVNRTLAPLFIRPDRLDVYRTSLYLVQDLPLTGIGLGGQFAMVQSRYALLIRYPFLTYSHNLYLEVWLEQGLAGAVAWLWLMAALFQAARTYARPESDFLYQGTWLGLTAIFVHGLSDARQYVEPWCWAPFFVLLGLNAGIILRRAPDQPRRRGWVAPAAVVGAFLIAVLFGLHPLPATLHANLGCVLQARGDLPASLDDGQRVALRQQAVDHYRRAIQSAPHDRTAQQRLGVILMDENRFGDAVEHLEAAWRVDPGNTTTHKALGLAYMWVGELEKAKPLLQNAPNIIAELNAWGWWRGTQQQVEQSINAYRMSLMLKPDQPGLQEHLGQLEGK